MSNERIDLTENGLRKHIIKYAQEEMYPHSDMDMGDVEHILHCIKPWLIDELKRMYEGVDALIEQLEIINNRETKNEVDGNLIVDYLKRL